MAVYCSTRDAAFNDEEGTLRMYLRGRPVVLYAPSPLVDSFDITKVATPPQAKLKLDWVYPFLASISTTRTLYTALYILKCLIPK